MRGERPTDYEVLSFDCYGTLIDWESGILVAMQPVLARHELVSTVDEILGAYARAESAVEAGHYRPYREVLRRTFTAMAKDLGFAPRADELETLVESLPHWDPFPDTVAALRALEAAGCRLAVISNVDDDLFAQTAERLEVEFDAVITAASVQRYKPSEVMFRRALQVLDIGGDRLLHAAQSRYHDIGPARRLGIRTVHVRRDSGRERSATPPAAGIEGNWSVDTVGELVELLGVT